MFKVVLIKGDGIGPEISDAVVEIFDAAKVPIQWIEKKAGLNAIDIAPNGIPDDTLEAIKTYQVALKGPTTTPVGSGHKSVNVTLRKALELYANVRPAKSLPGVRSRFDNVDLIIIRENIEDTYGGIEHHQTSDVAQCLKLITRPGSIRIAKYAFEMAKLYGRKKVLAVHKANIHKITDGLFLKCFYEVAQEYPEIQASDLIVDNTCMQLVVHPERFDVLVLPNLYGDIVSDLCAGLVGGLGVAPGGNIGDSVAIFEAVHGSAPDIAGQGIANPTALLLSSFQMLQHIGLHKTKQRIENALIQTLKDGIATRDLGGNENTKEFVSAIIKRLEPPFENEFIEPAPLRIKSELLKTHKDVVEYCHGVDIFVENPTGVPNMPQQVGKLKLKMISNRGTKVFPGPQPNIWLVDHHRCRYIATDEDDNFINIGDDEIFNLIREVSASGIKWMHIEKLQLFDGEIGYSKAQGE
ncbi:MAG: NADP-dependent isocitrate dehydrogenase [Ignavibacterium sp.]|nr:NADP-dependent isocitrate dehydrogenase [Ignavibacterium sp.]MCX7610167.1 NADP-dependent isocitrate dehydrogenase [Ignavibacterium sp.]MDW8375352.1 NADP-dependent isocitrate dehydrogenase [Ignavibacteriales bacterium]